MESDPGLSGGLSTFGYAYQYPANNFDPDRLLAWFPGLEALGGPGTSTTAGAGFWIMGGLLGGAVSTASISGSTSQSSAEAEAKNCSGNCPQCITVTGRLVDFGTRSYRPLDAIPDDKMQHGVFGSHHNIFVAKQAPRGSLKSYTC